MPHSIAVPDACQWLNQSLLHPLPPPPALDWLFDEGSLTRRLTHLSNDGFSVTPLYEGWQPLRDDECAALDLPVASIGWVREVYLRGHGQAWVFARQAFEVCHYPRAWLPKADQASGLWARRSRFDRGALSVLVAEVFLPSLWQAVQQSAENG